MELSPSQTCIQLTKPAMWPAIEGDRVPPIEAPPTPVCTLSQPIQIPFTWVKKRFLGQGGVAGKAVLGSNGWRSSPSSNACSHVTWESSVLFQIRSLCL